ncbi:FAD-dependent oxidoreductase [uncultured Anaerococcus sp.]|uniref:FAD-dependent oxidoreductase n=1 Tax=uncultured Anaerococcus sp. TaxID=293428 RepID=UPI0025D91CE4|nr:FAD-dependent oxidoreductase [uncultured Anaerococcus sp.]
MKKIKLTALALALALPLSACGKENEVKENEVKENEAKNTEIENTEVKDTETKETRKEKEETTSKDITIDDGSFEEIATGHNGDIKLSVTFKDNKIEAIDVLESSETPVIADTGFEDIIDRILDHQTSNVDTITGATVTSNAVKSAVSKAIDEANGSEDFKRKVEEEAKELEELDTELLVIGGGGAGLTAALSADEKGHDVVLLEKNAMAGGHTALSGAFTLITGSEVQKDVYGVTDDSIESVYEDNMKNGENESIPEDLQLYAEKMGEATDWTIDYVGSAIPEKLTPLGENSKDRAMIYEGAGEGFVKSLLDKLEETEVDFRKNTKVTELIYEDGKVTGAKAEMSDGTPVEVKADAVLIATGSYAANKEMLPERLDNFVYYGAQLAQGEGQKMAEDLGADVVNQGNVELFENGVEWQPGIAKSTYNGSMASWDVSGILVDRSGKRVVNERSAGINIVKEMEKQEDARLFLIMDEDTYKAFEDNVAGYGITKKMLDDWFATDGEKVPYFAKADTLEELANKVNIDAKELEETVERYNGFVENQNDEDFGRDPKYLQAKIKDNGPYYVVEQLPRFATTLGGLKIDNQLRVIDKDGNAIEGLYASGDVAGGARGNDSIPGADVGWAITSGYEAGRTISEFLNNK